MQVKTGRIKILIITIAACSFIALSLFIIKSFTQVNSEGISPDEITSASEQRLQSQIDDLSTKLSVFNNILSQLQSQSKATGTQAVSPANEQQVLSKIDAFAADTQQLSFEIDSLQAQVATLQGKLEAADAAIGITPVTSNGLSITFITANIEIGMTGSSYPGTGQFAIKIANTTDSALTNVDVTGTITSSRYFSGTLASGYPQLSDGNGLCSYVFFITEDEKLNFEAFGNAKTGLSIPAGGSITLRPKISILATANENLPAMTFGLALNNISYDTVAVK
jgi:uncharacterized protein YlxW (UPF0749 family)